MKTQGSRFLSFMYSESRLFAEYRKKHPHMWICLSSEALLVVLLTTGGYTISQTLSPDIDTVMRGVSGTSAMTAEKMIQHVQDRRISVYWFGPNTDSRYSIICHRREVKILSVFPQDSAAPIKNRPRVVIETYLSAADARTDHPLASASITKTAVTALGRTVEYDTAWMREIDVQMKSTKQFIHIHYSTPQDIQTMLRDANRLEPI